MKGLYNLMTNMKEKIKEHILNYNHFKTQNIDVVEDDFKLIDSGVITSIDIVNLIGFLEKCFGIEIFVEEVIPENFQTIIEIQKFVEKKKLG